MVRLSSHLLNQIRLSNSFHLIAGCVSVLSFLTLFLSEEQSEAGPLDGNTPPKASPKLNVSNGMQDKSPTQENISGNALKLQIFN